MLQADRSLIDRRARDEPTGEVMTLSSHLDEGKFGDRAMRNTPADFEARKAKRAKKESSTKQTKPSKVLGASLSQSADLEVRV